MRGAGERDRLIRFRVNTPVRNALGVLDDGWSDGPSAWAKVTFGAGDERREAAAVGAVQTATFRVLSHASVRAINAGARIVFEGREWRITSAVGAQGRDIEFVARVTDGVEAA